MSTNRIAGFQKAEAFGCCIKSLFNERYDKRPQSINQSIKCIIMIISLYKTDASEKADAIGLPWG